MRNVTDVLDYEVKMTPGYLQAVVPTVVVETAIKRVQLFAQVTDDFLVAWAVLGPLDSGEPRQCSHTGGSHLLCLWDVKRPHGQKVECGASIF